MLRLALLACSGAVALNAVAIVQPLLFMDDFQILAKCWTWQTTCTYLWLPQNEHIMPLGRLSTWAGVAVAGRLSALPLLAALHGPAALVLAMGLVYLFVRRELGQPLYGLVAMTLFGVTAVYQQAVYWFSASFSILALDMLLLGLLAAQRWRQTGSRRQLLLSAFWCLLAPGWFASGILAGPFCFLYLLPREEDKETGRQGDKESCLRHLLGATGPLVGTAIFVVVVIGLLRPVVEHIRRLEHYGDKTAEQAFHPLIGAGYSARSVVDNLLPGLVGVWGVERPVRDVVIVWLVLIVAAGWWIWRSPQRRLCWLGLAMIGLSYWLVYSARAEWPYEGLMNAPNWSRYHLVPQLGLTLLLCAGLARWPGWFQASDDGRLTSRQIAAMGVLILGCFLVQLPHGIAGQWGGSSARFDDWLGSLRDSWSVRQAWYNEQQMALREIEAMDARCRLYQISRETARDALPRLEIPFSDERENGWEFLWGSPHPREMTVEEARRLLASGGGVSVLLFTTGG